MRDRTLDDLIEVGDQLILAIGWIVALVLVFALVAPDAGALARREGFFTRLFALGRRLPGVAVLLACGLDGVALAVALPLARPAHQARRRRRRGRRLDLHHKELLLIVTVRQREALSKAGCLPPNPIPAIPVRVSHDQGACCAELNHQWRAQGVWRAAAERGAIGAVQDPAHFEWKRGTWAT